MASRLPPPSERPLPSSFDDNEEFYNESGFQKLARKIKKEPLVPLGCILTVAAFTGAYRAMRRGDHHQVNRMFRARIAAQAFTLLAMVAGGIYYSDDRHKEREAWKAKRDADAEEKRLKWIRELEARDEEDRLAKELLDKRRERAAAIAAKREEKKAAATAAAAGTGSDEAKSSSGLSWAAVPGWLGGKNGEAEQSSTKDANTDAGEQQQAPEKK